MSLIAVGGTFLAGGAITAGTVAAGAALAGTAATLYGQNKQAKANQAAQNANIAAQDKQNNQAWSNWLMTRGIAPNTTLEAGTMPTAANSTAVNSRLPLWANVTYGTSVTGQPTTGGIRLVKKGTPTRTGITGFAGWGGASGSNGATTPATGGVGSGTSLYGNLGSRIGSAGNLYSVN